MAAVRANLRPYMRPRAPHRACVHVVCVRTPAPARC
jgi:hypothetical protein